MSFDAVSDRNHPENWPSERLAAARDRVVRFVQLRNVVTVLFWLALIVSTVVLFLSAGIVWAVITFFAGGFAVGVLIAPLVLVPLGYLLFGKDAMKLQSVAERRRG